jgi:hypothetical protein
MCLFTYVVFPARWNEQEAQFVKSSATFTDKRLATRSRAFTSATVANEDKLEAGVVHGLGIRQSLRPYTKINKSTRERKKKNHSTRNYDGL